VRTAATVVGLVVIVAVVALAGYPVGTAAVIVAVGLSKAFDGVSDIYWGLLQKREQMQSVAISLIVRNLLSLAALIAAVVVTGSIIVGAFASAACSALVLLTYDVRRTARRSSSGGRARLDRRRLASLAWKTLPLGVATMLVALNANIPRYFVEAYFGERELGVYAAVGSLMVVGITIVTAIADSATPRLAAHVAAADRPRFARVLAKLIVLGLLLGGAGIVVAVVAGKTVLELLFGAEYARYDELLLWTMLIAPVNYTASFLGYSMTALRAFKVQPVLIAASSAVAVAASFALVPEHGLVGAAWATGLSLAAQLGGGAIVVAARTRRRVSEA
jgi:O-antigen/teichoic acid export membrane protein